MLPIHCAQLPSLSLFTVSAYLSAFLPRPTLTRQTLLGCSVPWPVPPTQTRSSPPPTPPPAGQSRYNCMCRLFFSPGVWGPPHALAGAVVCALHMEGTGCVFVSE